MQISLPSDKRLLFEADYHESESATGEYKYSLGDPPKEAWWEITAVAWSDTCGTVDITDFVTQYADSLLHGWENELFEQNPNGEE
jgi:hypothetical protein